MTPIEKYKAKKIAEFEEGFYPDVIHGRGEAMQIFLSQTIDELWALPEKKGIYELKIPEAMKTFEEAVCFKEGYLFCIAEAERMRDLLINK